MDAILLAFVLNPQTIRHAPMKEEPRYPAGRVIQEIPPDILVAPPSSAENLKMNKAALARCRAWEPKQDVRSSSIECILAHVSTPAKAWLIYSNVNKASIKTLETVPHEIRLSGAYSKLWLSIV